ncbi:LacI family DNA-binding transcriptional regulator [Neorhizobium tomejilense]|uniref:LacI family DNA-binding transcriptional regulator n=1 Tax=Neorhizobium tomejilense TaxID=2093828 RepID=UPI000CF8FD52|nr:LacI family DNA-binding transcriptional regulator [Neorhizobium tomejilense]
MPPRRARSERVTLLDVANVLGISSITVSRALREPEKVSEPLRQKILCQVEQMGYVPDLAARALASRHNGIIGVLAPALTNHAYLGIMSGIEERVRDTDFRIQYANTNHDAEQEYRQVKLFLSQHPAGILLTGLQDQRVSDLLELAPCPVVQIVDLNLLPSGIAVGINHREAAETATRHLLACGYRRIGLIGGSRDLRAQRRHDGYALAMQEAGLYDPGLVMTEHKQTSMQLGCDLFKRLLETAPDVDAVFCQNDDLALGALFEAQRAGLRVPDDFGICGYNDLDFALCAEPRLTTVRVPRFQMGYQAADLIVRAINDECLPSRVIQLPFELVQRGSTRPLA